MTSRPGERVYLDIDHELSINEIGRLMGHECDPNLNLNYDMMWYQQLAEANERDFGCSVPWHPNLISRKTNKKIEICRNSTLAMKANDQFDNLMDTGIAGLGIPCAKYKITPGLTDRDDTGNNPNEAYTRLYLNTKIRVQSIVLHYDSTTLGAEIGGLVGMLLGVSLVDIAIISNSYVLKMVAKFLK